MIQTNKIHKAIFFFSHRYERTGDLEGLVITVYTAISLVQAHLTATRIEP